MPVIVRLDHKSGVRITTATGTVSADDFLDAYRQILKDAELNGATSGLADLRRASLTQLTSTEMRMLAELPPLPRQAESRLAIVASNPADYGMARMFSLLRDGRRSGEAQVFSSYHEAWSWLGPSGASDE